MSKLALDLQVEYKGENLLAEGSYPVGNELKGGHPEFNMKMLKKLGWDKDLTSKERAVIDKIAGDKTNWKTDLSGDPEVAIKHAVPHLEMQRQGSDFSDPIPLHREPLYTPRRDLLPKYAT